MRIATFSGLTLVAFLANSPPIYGADCRGYSDEIEHSLKLIAMSEARGLGDNSVPRATLDEQRITNQLLRIQINLDLMKASACALPREPIRPSDYMKSALDCSLAELKGNPRATECNLDLWTRQAGPGPAATATPAPQPPTSTPQPSGIPSPSSSAATAPPVVAKKVKIGEREISVGDEVTGPLAALLGQPDQSTYKPSQRVTVKKWTRGGHLITALNDRIISIE